jgi:hypothetical protein
LDSLQTFNDSRVLEQKRLRADYKSNNVQIRKTFEFKTLTGAEDDTVGALKRNRLFGSKWIFSLRGRILGPGRQTGPATPYSPTLIGIN